MNRVAIKGSGNKLAFNLKNIDLKLFKSSKTQCHQTPIDIPITERCSSLLRLCTASKYIDAVTASGLDDKLQMDLLVEFNEDVYSMMLNDTIHLVKEHSDDVQQIQMEWVKQYGFPKCTVSECARTTRHYGRGRREESNMMKGDDEVDPLYDFYRSLFDRVHHFVSHLYDIGLRVDTDSLGLSGGGNDDEVDTEGVTVDSIFAAERDRIRLRREQCHLDLDRFEDANNKFTIQIAPGTEGAVTLRDVLFQKLSENINVATKTLQRLQRYFEIDSYDTDCIEMDVEDLVDSNVCRLVQNESAVQTMADFIRSTKLHRSAFSTGFIFNYWGDEKPLWVEEGMSVLPKFETVKEEVIESGFLSLSNWHNRVMPKAQQYMETRAVRELTAQKAWAASFTEQHDVGAALTIQYLLAVILYCDYGPLCTAFSATFRLKNAFETVEALKARHSEFAIFGKLLVELVLDFGVNMFDAGGPFYCGLNSVLNIGSYAIRMKGPCSTSITRAVAVNFAKSNGVIMKVDHDGDTSSRQCFFDCSWISSFYGEDEMLWIAGQWPLRIISIVVVRTAKNYSKAMRALYLFDAMISGVSLFGSKVQEEHSDFELISNLMSLEYECSAVVAAEFDSYIKREWNLFLRNKREIVLDIKSICICLNKYMSKLILFNVVKNRNGVAKGNENLLKPRWLSLFPDLCTVTIDTKEDAYQFRLMALLMSIQSLSHSVKIIVIDQDRWIQRDLTDEIVTAFVAAGWSITYKEKERRLVIESKNKIEFGI